jgi:hypothetical protein
MSHHAQAMNGRQTLELAFARLQAMLPRRAARCIAWLHSPQARWVRIPAGLLCILASAFWFLPIVGIEWLPIGLLLLAQDLPFLRKPVGLLMLFLLAQAQRLQHWWRARRR